MKFPTINETRKFITVFTRTQYKNRIVGDKNPVHTARIYLYKLHFHIKFVPTFKLPSDLVPSWLPTEIPYIMFHSSHAGYMPFQSHPSTRSPFVTLLSRRAQSGRWSSFGRRVWFTESHLVLLSFPLCFIYSFYFWYNEWSVLSSKTTRSFLGNWHSHFSVLLLTPHLYTTEFALDC